MASRSGSEDYRECLRRGAMDFDLLVLFTAEPPVGEDFFTVISKKVLVKVPIGVIPDGRMTDEARLATHILTYKAPKGRTPRMSQSSIFSRIERGYNPTLAVQEVSRAVTGHFLKVLKDNGGKVRDAYQETVQHFHEGLPIGRAFATLDDTHWIQGELTHRARVDKSGNITVPSDMEEQRHPQLVRTDSNMVSPGTQAHVASLYGAGQRGNFYKKPEGPRESLESEDLFQEVERQQSGKEGQDVQEQDVQEQDVQEQDVQEQDSQEGPFGDPHLDKDHEFVPDSEDEEAPPKSKTDLGLEAEANQALADELEQVSHEIELVEAQVNAAKAAASNSALGGSAVTDREEELGSNAKKPKKALASLKKSSNDDRPDSPYSSIHSSDFASDPDATSLMSGDSNRTPPPRRTRIEDVLRVPARGARERLNFMESPNAAGSSPTPPAPHPTASSSSPSPPGKPRQSPASSSPSPPPKHRSSGGLSAAEMLAAIDHLEIDDSPMAMALATKKVTNKTGANKRRFGEGASAEAEGDNREISSQMCSIGCKCPRMTLAEIRDNCQDPKMHQLLIYNLRLHNSQMNSNVDTRREIAAVMTKLSSMEEELQEISSYAKAGAGRVTANEMREDDSTMLQLKWQFIDQVDAASQDPDMKNAILRVMYSDIVSGDVTHVISKCFMYFMTEDLVTRLLLKMPPGKGKCSRIFIWGEEYYLLPSSFLNLLKHHCISNLKLDAQKVMRKIRHFLNDGRQRRKFARKTHILDQSELALHPMYKIVVMDEAAGSNIVSMRMPQDDDPEELKDQFSNKYFSEVVRAYKNFLTGEKAKDPKVTEAVVLRRLREAGTGHGVDSDSTPNKDSARKRKKKHTRKDKERDEDDEEAEDQPPSDAA